MKRKILSFAAILMCLAALSGLITSCGGSEKGTESLKAGLDPTQYDKKEVLKPVGHTEKVKFTLATWANRPVWPDHEINVMLSGIEKKFNVELDVQVYNTNYLERLNMMAVGDELPDAWVSTLPWVQEKKWVSDGILLNLDPFLDNMPNYKAVRADDIFWEPIKIDGKLYALPSVDNPNDCGPMIRKDWLTAINKGVPTTLDELADVLKAFTENDPDGNGKADTSGGAIYSGGLQYTVMGAVMGAYDAYFDMWYKSGNEIVYGGVREEFKDALKYMKNLINQGYISTKNLEVIDGNQIQTLNMAGDIGVTNFAYQIITEGSPLYKNFKKKTENKGEYVAMSPLIGPSGKKGTINARESVPSNRVCLNADIKNPERLLEIFDWMMSEEGANYVQYGIEGHHYEVSDGKIVFKAPYDDANVLYKEGFDEQFMLFSMRTLWGNHLTKNALDGAAILKENTVYYPVYSIELPSATKLIPNYTPHQTKFIFNALADKSFDIDAEWDKMKQEIMAAGLKELTAEANDLAKKKGIIS